MVKCVMMMMMMIMMMMIRGHVLTFLHFKMTCVDLP